ncbi:MAG: peptidoglycan DD-metalloendopeptidase family protein [Melioribacteraceae bacterium]|nr:peptidoglycan DD-metalloendopeptidase family protein [Melioribacteraceae bacterium]
MVRLLSILLLIGLSTIQSQNNGEIEQRSSELNLLREQISEMEKDLAEIRKEESSSRKVLKKLDEENLLLNRAINNLKIQEQYASAEIKRLDDSIKYYSGKIKELQDEYAGYIKWLFMYGKESKFKLLFGSRSLNQAVMRYKYLELISERSEKTHDELKIVKAGIENLRARHEEEIKRKNNLITQKNEQLGRLNSSRNEKEKLLRNLLADEINIGQEIEEKRRAEIEIKNLIARLEEEERERERKRLEEKLRSGEESKLPSFNYASFQDFSELRGTMNWPVDNGSVIRTFGENRNAKLNTVTLNYGIDIQTRPRTKVRAVAEGVVSAIEWIPGYGSVIILTHKDKYRTVYGHISDILVEENRKVNAGDLLGTVNESLEGNIIHFEIWNSRNYQNPDVWLAKK